jgi:hypothetical protein
MIVGRKPQKVFNTKLIFLAKKTAVVVSLNVGLDYYGLGKP